MGMPPKTLAIVGPTASGKTGFGMRLAEALGGEIVNADAFQVYRGFDIGTAKPEPSLLERVPHHLIDILDPSEPFSAGEFARRARQAIRQIHDRGRVAIVIGGSGLYLRALFDGLAPLPRCRPELRAELEERLTRDGLSILHAELWRVDPETAERLEPRDRQRILRALEIYLASGEAMSDWLRRKPAAEPLPVSKFGLTLPRAILYDRIAFRVNHMVERGWADEVLFMLDSGIESSAPAFRAIGYRQMARHVRGESTLDEVIDETCRDSRRYAKRQLTWFRKEPSVCWLPALELDRVVPTVLRDIRAEERWLDEQA
ncbi:MAG: tRNA (adenosine(37)-N6)-dimethylallyltransferase MiaA [Acidobacteriota bacterium]